MTSCRALCIIGIVQPTCLWAGSWRRSPWEFISLLWVSQPFQKGPGAEDNASLSYAGLLKLQFQNASPGIAYFSPSPGFLIFPYKYKTFFQMKASGGPDKDRFFCRSQEMGTELPLPSSSLIISVWLALAWKPTILGKPLIVHIREARPRAVVGDRVTWCCGGSETTLRFQDLYFSAMFFQKALWKIFASRQVMSYLETSFQEDG